MPFILEEQFLQRQTLETSPAMIVPYEKDMVNPVLTLIIRPDDVFRAAISTIVEELKALDPNQYFYQESQYHFTIVGEIPGDTDTNQAVPLIQDILDRHVLEYKFRGIQMNNRTVYLPVYFAEDTLHLIREELRQVIPALTDYNSYLPGLDSVGWLNIARFKQPFNEELKHYVLRNSEREFEEPAGFSIELYANRSLTLDEGSRELLKRFS